MKQREVEHLEKLIHIWVKKKINKEEVSEQEDEEVLDGMRKLSGYYPNVKIEQFERTIDDKIEYEFLVSSNKPIIVETKNFSHRVISGVNVTIKK